MGGGRGGNEAIVFHKLCKLTLQERWYKTLHFVQTEELEGQQN